MNLLIAFTSGILSFLSPCIVPLIPSLLAIIGGISVAELQQNQFSRKTVFYRTLVFVFGIIVPFVLLGMSASAVGSLLARYQTIISQSLGFVVILFGLHLLGILQFHFMQKEYRMDSLFAGKGGKIGVFLMGLAFGFAWTPCVGPFLGSILILASNSATVWQGGFLLLIYGLGLGIPFLLIGLVSTFALKQLGKAKKYMRPITIFSGILLIAIGILIVTGKFVYLNPLG